MLHISKRYSNGRAAHGIRAFIACFDFQELDCVFSQARIGSRQKEIHLNLVNTQENGVIYLASQSYDAENSILRLLFRSNYICVDGNTE